VVISVEGLGLRVRDLKDKGLGANPLSFLCTIVLCSFPSWLFSFSR